MTDCQFGPIDDRMERIEMVLCDLIYKLTATEAIPNHIAHVLLKTLKRPGSGS